MKAFVSDFDGTIFFPDRKEKISRSDILAIKKFREKNLFGVCTGRPFVGLKPLFDAGIECDFYILTNGALVLNDGYHPLFQASFQKEDVLSLLSWIQSYECAFQTTEEVIGLKESDAFPVSLKVVDDLTPYFDRIIGVSLATPSEEIAKDLSEKISKMYDLSAFSNQHFVDIIDKRCSKGNAVNFIKDHFLLEKVYAIGDSYNDMSMLKAADVSFTLQEAPQDVKQAADHVVESISQAMHQVLEK